LARGVELDGSRTAPATFQRLDVLADGTWVRVVLREGRNRQIRRMADTVGLDVQRLVRVRIGSLHLGSQRPGTWRHLRADEVDALRGRYE
jgi:23S rRNA pseudouridine2605 synthase